MNALLNCIGGLDSLGLGLATCILIMVHIIMIRCILYSLGVHDVKCIVSVR